MRFHVVGLPHTIVTKSWSNCAYTQKIYNFCVMMMGLGHEVYLYAAEGSDAPCTELVQVVSRTEQLQNGFEGPEDILKAEFNPQTPYWQVMNMKAVTAIVERRQDQDFLCIIAGLCQKQVADGLPGMMAVEYGIGYGGVFAPYKVFESYAWMHTVAGARAGDPHQANGQYYDAVIPNYFDPADFPLASEKGDYFLYMGRLIDRKGWRVAQEVCERLGRRLIVAGQGEFSGYGEYVGVVGPVRRAELLGGAQAVFVPTQYVEPFGGVAIEANLCGTPVLTTDWGAFTETVTNGFNGYRCRTLGEFVAGASSAATLDTKAIRRYAINRFSLDSVASQYQAYFERLMTLYDSGWYADKSWLVKSVMIPDKETPA